MFRTALKRGMRHLEKPLSTWTVKCCTFRAIGKSGKLDKQRGRCSLTIAGPYKAVFSGLTRAFVVFAGMRNNPQSDVDEPELPNPCRYEHRRWTVFDALQINPSTPFQQLCCSGH
ncbi:hypothetical protein AcW1_006315 [Taiwanofungus camphoratus]|nr:hypothetical protein AcW2_005070 [Antrodia cinnamomea]KAI0934954.1 hypothetical protein AcV5_006636 [Antrodia cinnamomea]KAI0949756.1 hypothetical protein AcV7_008429 [Antrodia cinnamomea]KAI0958146.1 hypothetical protein AcW1_006315 [Antrodia cinnamomea]